MLLLNLKGVFIMASVSMNIRMDSDIKSKAQSLFSEFGLDMTTAINMFLRQAIRENGIPFKLNLNAPNKETLKTIRDINNKKNLSRPFSSIDDLMRDLNA